MPYYEAKLVDGWLWHRFSQDQAFREASPQETIAYLIERLAWIEDELDSALMVAAMS